MTRINWIRDGCAFEQGALELGSVRCIIQRPSLGADRYVNAIVDVELNRVDRTWGILDAFKIVQQFPARAMPKEFEHLPVLHKGYCDTHLHAVWMASQQNKLSLRGLTSVDAVHHAIAKFAAESPTEYVQAFDWDQEVYGVSSEDFAQGLERFCRERQIECVAFRVCAHMAVVTEGLRLRWSLAAGTALLRDAQLDPVHEKLFRWSPEEAARLFESAQAAFLERGITGISEMSVNDGQLQGILDLAKRGRLKIDVQVVLDHEVRATTLRAGPFVEFNASDVGPLGTPAQVQVRHVKRFLDGSLGARTAWLRAPYDDDEVFGDSLFKDEELFQWAERSLRDGWLLAFHAIGDGALDQIYRLSLHCRDLLKNALRPEYSPFFKHSALHRIEHAQVMGDDLLRALTTQGYWSFLVQPYHRVADQGFAMKRLGPTRFYNEGYRLRSLTTIADLRVGLGSDAPIASWEPSEIIAAAATHPNPLERLGRLDALWHYTTGARLALGLEPGKIGVGSTVVISEHA